MINDKQKRNGLTLIELLAAISVALVIAGVIAAVLKTSFDVYAYTQEQILLEKALDETLDNVTGASMEDYGIKDALELLDISAASITFVPIYVDNSYTPKPEYESKASINRTPFTLGRPVRAGTSMPLAEMMEESLGGTIRGAGRWKVIPITFISANPMNPLQPEDTVLFNMPISPAGKVRFIYQPDASAFPDCAMAIRWEDGKITRKYRGKLQAIPRYDVPGAAFSDFNIQYFDNTNTEVKPTKDNIPNVTAVKVNLTAAFSEKQSRGLKDITKLKQRPSKTGYAFVNLRNTRTGGAGLLIQRGTRIRLPESAHVRMFSLTNVTGAISGGVIELEARATKSSGWKAIIELGLDGSIPIMKRYTVEYPIGNPVHSESVNLPPGTPLNFMNIGPAASYGSSHSKANPNMIKMSGDVELIITRMDAKGAMLFIRP